MQAEMMDKMERCFLAYYITGYSKFSQSLNLDDAEGLGYEDSDCSECFEG